MEEPRKFITVIIPAYNEALSIEKSVHEIDREIKSVVKDYELLIINDGSSDNTKKIANQIAKKNAQVKVLHHGKNLGFGATFRQGVLFAKGTYITQFHPDNDTSAQSVKRLILNISKAQIIMSYYPRAIKRSKIRRVVSQAFVSFMNTLFGYRFNYFNGYFVAKSKALRSIVIKSGGFMAYAEAKIRLIEKGFSYYEVPADFIGRKAGQSKAVSLRSFIQTLSCVAQLYWEFRIVPLMTRSKRLE